MTNVSVLLEAYAELLARMVGTLCGLEVVNAQVLATTFTLEFDVACTAAVVTVVTTAIVVLMTPGAVRNKLATGAVIAVAMQACNLVRLICVVWAGDAIGIQALLWVHDWIAPAWMAAMIAVIWILLWRRLSNFADYQATANPR